jgi:hypothetical protein
MKNGSILKRMVLASAACIALSTVNVAQANPTLVASGWANGHEDFTVSNHSGTVHAGGFSGTWGGTPIVFWCYEMGQSFGLPGTYTDYTAIPLVNLRISALFQADLASALSGPVNVNSAAFQLAIWNILYDSDNRVDTGTWFASGDVNAINLANTWLASLPSTSSFSLVQLTSREHQDFVTPGGPLLVPEPAPLPLLGAGLAIMMFAMRRRKVS